MPPAPFNPDVGDMSADSILLAIRGANDGLWDWDLRADRLSVSARFRAMVGFDPALVPTPQQWFERIHPEDLPAVRKAIESHLDGRTPHVEAEHRLIASGGPARWLLLRGLAIRDAADTPYRMAGSITDITDRKSAEERLVREAFCDPLTGLANRTLLQNRLQLALDRSRRHADFQFAVMFLDLDRFKVVNDGLGHAVGDLLIIEFAARIRQAVRPTDTVARLGGDEFIILLEEMSGEEDAVRVANRLHEALKEPFVLGEHEVFTTASIGIAPGSPRYPNIQDLLRDADAAMYRAKALGKSRHEIFDAALHEQAMQVLKLETDLRRAIEREEFVLHFQPIMRLGDGRLVGLEALVRWRHPDRGMVSPAVFIPMMEETGLIAPLGEWVLREACRQLSAWRRQFSSHLDLNVSINVSGRQLTGDALFAQVESALEDSGLPAKCLTLEITEGVMVSNSEHAAQILKRLRERGVRISVDDFGVGYSSLSQLHRFPLDALKIDRSFLQHIDENGRDDTIIRTIITLANNLGLTTTAEGVETALQLQRLRALGATHAQGYLIARPMGAEQIQGMLAGGAEWVRRAG